jgi:hypothetical protein
MPEEVFSQKKMSLFLSSTKCTCHLRGVEQEKVGEEQVSRHNITICFIECRTFFPTNQPTNSCLCSTANQHVIAISLSHVIHEAKRGTIVAMYLKNFFPQRK